MLMEGCYAVVAEECAAIRAYLSETVHAMVIGQAEDDDGYELASVEADGEDLADSVLLDGVQFEGEEDG